MHKQYKFSEECTKRWRTALGDIWEWILDLPDEHPYFPLVIAIIALIVSIIKPILA